MISFFFVFGGFGGGSSARSKGTEICYDVNVKPLGYCPTKWQCCPGTQWCCPEGTVCHVQKDVKCVKRSLIYNPLLLSLAVIIFLMVFGFKRVSDGKRKKTSHLSVNSSDMSTR